MFNSNNIKMQDVSIIEKKIHEVRGEMVLLDFDLAFLYEVDTKTLNQAVKRNITTSPFAFTEHGVAMISGVLKSEKAVKMNISIIRLFIEMKKVLIKNTSIKGQLQELRERIEEHDGQLNKIYDTIENLLDLSINRVKWEDRNRIGFNEKKDN